MRVWKFSRLDAVLFFLCLVQLTATFTLASLAGPIPQFHWLLGGVILLAFQWYNLIVISHQFTHTPWFISDFANSMVSIVNSMNIAQSMSDYHLRHVHNHHRFHNDRHTLHKPAQDWASTFHAEKLGSHIGLVRYTFVNTIPVFLRTLRECVAVHRLWKVGSHEQDLFALLSRDSKKRSKQLRQMQAERVARFLTLALLLAISWKWVLVVYIPVLYLSLCLFFLQNYYEHVGALPESHYSNSVSHYGKAYNFFTCNDGYHQEHHLRPRTHWRDLPKVRSIIDRKLGEAERVISPVPAIFGFLHNNRPQLHLYQGPKDKIGTRKGGQS